MLYAVYCVDKPDSASIRAANRTAHLEHVSRHQDRILTAGPLVSEDGQNMIGSLLILDFEDRVALGKFLVDDPYAKAGLFAKVDVQVYRQVFPKKDLA